MLRRVSENENGASKALKDSYARTKKFPIINITRPKSVTQNFENEPWLIIEKNTKYILWNYYDISIKIRHDIWK